MSIHDVDPNLAEAVARTLLKEIRPHLGWESVSPETRDPLTRAAIAAVAMVRLWEGMEKARTCQVSAPLPEAGA
jgi:hypothetical protein